jgi:transglutaminase-like putative cysteine protease
LTSGPSVRHSSEWRIDPSRWSPRDWLLPWVQIALCLGAALPAVPLFLAGVVVLVLVRIPIASGPLPYRRRWGWVVLLVSGLWWMREAVSQPSGAGAFELVRIAGWCLLLLACVQILSLGRGGSRVLVAWNTLGATWLLSGGEWSGSAFLVAQGLVAIESLRAAHGRSWRSVPVLVRWLAGVALAFGIVVGQQTWGLGQGMWGRSSWKEPSSRVKGFSVVARLGTFGPSYQPDREREVAVRVWTSLPPHLLRGMVHDLYSKGSWIATRRSPYKSPERMSLDFSQFCRDASDEAKPLAWAMSPDDHLPVLFAPSATGCVGVVADSLRVSGAGVFQAPSNGASRGWTWYRREERDSATVPSDLRIPSELGGLLDSAWLEIDPVRGGETAESAASRLIRMSRWLERSFRYDLDVPQEPDLDPLRTFLRLRRGYCEYFASLSVLLLRRSGIPARYVTGLSDPEAAPDGRSWIYRQGGAHAWVEWKMPDGNWQTFDPTPSGGAPTRTGGLSAGLTEFVSGWSAYAWHILRDGTWRNDLDRWQERWDSVPQEVLWVLAALAILVAGGWFWRHRRVGSAEGWAGVLARGEAILRRQGHVRRPDETVGDFLARLPQMLDPQARKMLERYQPERWKP